MAKLRPARCYRKIQRPYTRQSQKKPRKGYVKGVPKPKIAQYEMGFKGDYSRRVFLIPDNTLQIRHNALEAARMSAIKYLEKNCKEFFFKLRVYPFHVIRENPLATGAGADRFQQGMRQSFGKPIGMVAQVKKGQKLFEVQVNDASIGIAKTALKRASQKLPLKYRVIVE
jgi:large subunit ribosomal protein L10e